MAGDGTSYAGRRVAAVLEDFRESGLDIAWSTNVVTDQLQVTSEPGAGSPIDIIRQILLPHGLTVREDSGVFIVVRSEASADPQLDSAADVPPQAPQTLDNVVVAASRYEISRDFSTSKFSLDRHSIQTMPDVGEDPVRATHRLPGTAASGASAQAHFRGGETNEVGIMLNGNWLFDPFHVRDYQNIFSAIDARAIQGVEVYTGGFPVRFGDRMSGLVLMDSLETDDPNDHHEIGLSVFNTSFLTAGSRGDRSWLFSARRGNLDLVIDPQYGQPSYFDVFGEYAFELSPATRVSVNALYADDKVELVLEAEPAERELVVSNTRNAQFWVQLASQWTENLSSNTVLSFVDYSNRRDGETNDEEKMVSTVRDYRNASQFGVQQDWAWTPSPVRRMQWGLHVTYSDADFNYNAAAEYFGLQAAYVNQPDELSRSLVANPDGASYALYFSDRRKLSDRSVVEWGLRWDDQTYTNLTSDSQLSPRLNVMYRVGNNSELRISAGRYHQSQAIQALQIEDGVTDFWPAQRADQLIAGFHHRLQEGNTAVRIEAFIKHIDEVRPRFENLYDPLGIIPELQPDRVLVAPSSARSEGFELSADRTVGAWTLWGSYTWSRVTDRIDGRDEPRSWDQRHAFQAGFAWHDEHWDFSAAASVHSGWPSTALSLAEVGVDDEGEPVYEATPGPRNAERYPSYASVDVRLSRRFEVRRGSLLAFIEVSNVLNRRNVCCLDWDIEDDGTLERGLDYWMPLLPAIGVLWEF